MQLDGKINSASPPPPLPLGEYSVIRQMVSESKKGRQDKERERGRRAQRLDKKSRERDGEIDDTCAQLIRRRCYAIRSRSHGTLRFSLSENLGFHDEFLYKIVRARARTFFKSLQMTRIFIKRTTI